MATAAQKKNIARFKAVQAEAKKLKAKNKSLSHIQAVKQAWAILYSKETKSAPKKKAAKKKVGNVLQSIKRKTVQAKKNIAYNVIDKTLKSANKTEKVALNKAKKTIKNTYIGASPYKYKLSGMNNFKKSKETQFYEILKDNKLMWSNFSIYGKTYAKLFANVKTIVSTGEKLIAPIVEDLYKKIENLPLKISVKPIGKKSKHYEYIDGKNQETIHQWTEYKLSL
jgi:hypothetical protein